MFKHGIDQGALIEKFSAATAQQGEALRKAVHDATLKALQGRELTLANIRQVLGTVAKATSSGAAASKLGTVDVEALLGKAVAGMDGALEQAVEANRRALAQMVSQGVTLTEAQTRKALANVEKMEGTLLTVLRKFADDAGSQMQKHWGHALQAAQANGTGTGAQAAAAIEQLMALAEKNAENLKAGRALGLQASQAMLDGYATLVSGVLIGMSGALQEAKDSPADPARSRKR